MFMSIESGNIWQAQRAQCLVMSFEISSGAYMRQGQVRKTRGTQCTSMNGKQCVCTKPAALLENQMCSSDAT